MVVVVTVCGGVCCVVVGAIACGGVMRVMVGEVTWCVVFVEWWYLWSGGVMKWCYEVIVFVEWFAFMT